MNFFKKAFWRFITQTIFKKTFNYIGHSSSIFKPLQLDGVNSIVLEDSVRVAEGAWLMGGGNKNKTLIIKTGTSIGHYSHIIGLYSLTVESNVLIADRVFISDCTHCYEDINIPVIKQNVKKLSSVTIGEGTWIGENVCVCGSSIGKHCVIGANSVVLSSIPDYCVAAGNPAKVIKKFDFKRNEWVRYHEETEKKETIESTR